MKEYTNFYQFQKTLDHNCIAANKYFKTSEIFYIIKNQKPAYYNIESLDEIENRILHLDLPEDYDDLNSKFSSIIKLWLLLIRYADLLVKNGYLNRCYFSEDYPIDDLDIWFELTDLNLIQRKLYSISEDFRNQKIEKIGGEIHYDGYIKELDEFDDIVKADIKLFKFYRKQIDDHAAEKIKIKKEIEKLLAE